MTLNYEHTTRKWQMKWRKISTNEIRVAIANPDRLEDTIKGGKTPSKT